MSKAQVNGRLDALRDAARARGVEVSIYRVARAGEIAAAIDGAQASGAGSAKRCVVPVFYGIGSSLWTASSRCACRRFMNGRKRRRRVALSPTGQQELTVSEIVTPQLVKLFRWRQARRYPSRTGNQVRAGD